MDGKFRIKKAAVLALVLAASVAGPATGDDGDEWPDFMTTPQADAMRATDSSG